MSNKLKKIGRKIQKNRLNRASCTRMFCLTIRVHMDKICFGIINKVNQVIFVDKRVLRKYDGKKQGWLKDTKKFLVLLVVVFLVFQLFVGFSSVKGDSMEPTLQSGNLVLYNRMSRHYQRGDVVSVRVPAGEYYVKRVIAIAGDTVELEDGAVYVNGEKLDEPYAVGETREEQGAVAYPYTLEENQVFVLGDNREVSMDSRAFGAVSERQIKGKLLYYAGKFFIRKVK